MLDQSVQGYPKYWQVRDDYEVDGLSTIYCCKLFNDNACLLSHTVFN